jgi:hypothetical protein
LLGNTLEDLRIVLAQWPIAKGSSRWRDEPVGKRLDAVKRPDQRGRISAPAAPGDDRRQGKTASHQDDGSRHDDRKEILRYGARSANPGRGRRPAGWFPLDAQERFDFADQAAYSGCHV